MTTLKKRLDEWKADGPLRAWRTEQELTLHDASALIGVGVSTIQVWEAGGRTPNADWMKALAKAMRCTLASLREEWELWQADMPS